MKRRDFQYYQAGLRDAVAFIHKQADAMGDPNARNVLNNTAFALGAEKAGMLPPKLTADGSSHEPTAN